MTDPIKTTPPAAPGDPKNLKNQPGPRVAEGGEQKPIGAGTAHTSPKDTEEESKPGDGSQDGVHGPEGSTPEKVVVEGLQTKSAPKIEKLKKNSRKRLTEEEAEKLSRAELRAVATDRGYEAAKGGRSVSVAAFLKAQEADDSLDEAEKVEKK